MREVGLPRLVVAVMAVSRLLDPLIRLRLRGPANRLRQCTNDSAPRQLDLKVVVAEASGISQHGLGHLRKVLSGCRRSVELRFGLTIAPWLMRHSAEREARLLNRATLDVQANRDRHEGERIRQAITELEIGVVISKALARQFDRRDDLVGRQIAVDLRRFAWQTMEVGK